MPNVTIYTTPWCVFCKKAKEFFAEHHIIYTEKDVQSDAVARDEMISRSGQMGVPVIDIGGKIVIGFDQGRMKELLNLE